jgi:hypothetical protein
MAVVTLDILADGHNVSQIGNPSRTDWPLDLAMKQHGPLGESEMTSVEPWTEKKKPPVYHPNALAGADKGRIKLSPRGVTFVMLADIETALFLIHTDIRLWTTMSLETFCKESEQKSPMGSKENSTTLYALCSGELRGQRM